MQFASYGVVQLPNLIRRWWYYETHFGGRINLPARSQNAFGNETQLRYFKDPTEIKTIGKHEIVPVGKTITCRQMLSRRLLLFACLPLDFPQ